jgi:hypothetical protein
MNLFHLEFENILTLINKAKKVTVPSLDELFYFDLLELQEQDYYRILTR